MCQTHQAEDFDGQLAQATDGCDLVLGQAEVSQAAAQL